MTKNAIERTFKLTLVTATVLLGTSVASAQNLNASKDRITDSAIAADHSSYGAVQGRIKGLNDKGVRVANYGLSKAQCWLDVSLHEYSRNDRSSFPQDAMNESVKLIKDMESSKPVSMDTPLVNGAAKLRQDLWDAASKLKSHPGWRCAEQKTACAEVELVHAGNEFNQQQWRHAKPYVQIAEDLIGDAQRAAEACIAPVSVAVTPVPATVAVAVPVVAPIVNHVVAPAPAMIPVTLAANVLFNFDRRDMPNVRPYTKDQLDTLIAQVKSGSVSVASIKLTGHADRLNGTGKTNYNVDLSKDRVSLIKEYMVAAGVNGALISSDFKADTIQIEACTKAKFRSTAELQECLLPNRRVEVVVTGTRKP